MKKLLKGVFAKILITVVILAFLGVGTVIGVRLLKPKSQTENVIVTMQERLEKAAELNTASYFCTEIITSSDTKTIKNIKVPFTNKKFIITYDAIVKAGIKDLTKAQLEEKENTIIVKLPNVEITEVTIDNDSFQQIDTTKNIFNPVTPEDVNDAQKDLKEKTENKAIEKGILKLAKENAEEILLGLLDDKTDTYEIKIEWQ